MEPKLPTVEDVMEILRGVVDPELGSNIVELGMAKGATVGTNGFVQLKIALTTSGCPLRAQIQKDAKARVLSLPGVTRVKIDWSELSAAEKAATMETARKNASQESKNSSIPLTARVLAIASGKGGVGKSSITTNLAVALAQQGYTVGVIDADIWGFSLPTLFGVSGRLEAGNKKDENTRPQIIPHSITQHKGRIDLVSMGMLVEDETAALLWRGLMLNRAVQHFLEDVAWDQEINYVLVDLPPGTGDVSMGLARMLPRAEMIVVTTPAMAAQKVAARAISMAQKCHLRVAGIIENMSVFIDPSGQEHNIFGFGGGSNLAEESGLPLLGQIAIVPELAQGGDQGEPIANSSHPAAESFHKIAKKISTEISPPIEMVSCTSRMLEAMKKAVDQKL